MITNPKQYDLVEIEWIDSTTPGDAGWVSIDDLLTEDDDFMLNCYTVGYLIRESEKDIWIVGSYHDNGDGGNCLGLIAIPQVAILERELLKKGEKENE